MKKKHLLSLEKLTATEEIIQTAKQDTPEPRVKSYRWNKVEYIYKYGMYLLAAVEQGILKVAFFQPNSLTLNGTSPIYTLFIDKEADSFIGYNHITKKWTTAMLERIREIPGGGTQKAAAEKTQINHGSVGSCDGSSAKASFRF